MAEWPRDLRWVGKVGRTLAATVADGLRRRPVSASLPGIVARKLLFLVVVLVHGFRRLFPPY